MSYNTVSSQDVYCSMNEHVVQYRVGSRMAKKLAQQCLTIQFSRRILFNVGTCGRYKSAMQLTQQYLPIQFSRLITVQCMTIIMVRDRLSRRILVNVWTCGTNQSRITLLQRIPTQRVLKTFSVESIRNTLDRTARLCKQKLKNGFKKTNFLVANVLLLLSGALSRWGF